MTPLQVVIPVNDSRDYFPESEFFFPKALLEICDEPMILHVAKCIEKTVDVKSFHIVIPAEIERKYSVSALLRINLNSRVEVIIRKGQTSGGLCSALLALDSLAEKIPLVIANMDEVLDKNHTDMLDFFVQNQCDAGVVTFYSSHPRWAYIVKDVFNNVLSAHEKNVVSKDAIAGYYFFKDKATFLDAASATLLDDEKVNNQFYLSSALNQLILKGGTIKAFEIKSAEYHSLYTPEKVKNYQEAFQKSYSLESPTPQLNILIPAAGNGNRFAKKGWIHPKPFIDINGSPMIQHVINNLNPVGAHSVSLILKEEHLDAISVDQKNTLRTKSTNIIKVTTTTEGTACTCLLARQEINNSTPLLIANSDQIVDFNVDNFVSDMEARRLDGSILVFKDVLLDPKWSFALINENNYVTRVAEKQPISDLATVGIYLFAKGSYFVSAAIDMIANNDRVNGEFYTCPVYNYMIKTGLKVGVYEIPVNAMHGIGTPDDLSSYIKLLDYPLSDSRPR